MSKETNEQTKSARSGMVFFAVLLIVIGLLAVVAK